MKLHYQTRLTLVAGLCSGLVIALIFATLLQLVARSESAGLQRDLQLCLEQAKAEIKENPRKPDFNEVAGGYPGLSIVEYSLEGSLVGHGGPGGLTLHPPSSMAVIRTSVDGNTLEVGISSQPTAARVDHLTYLVWMFWAPLTAAVTLAIWFAARSVFAPLKSITDQAAILDDRCLNVRLEMIYGGEYDLFTEKLNGLLDRIQSSFNRQERFACDAAHELRTPLTVLSGQLQEKLRVTALGSAEAGVYEGLLAEIERLSSVVDMLLESSRPKGIRNSQKADVGECLERSASRWLDRFTQREVFLDVVAESHLAAISASEIETIIENLLSNALRTGIAKRIVRLQNFELEAQNVIVVEDDGPGIPAQGTESPFAPFVPTQAGRNPDKRGFGLGLAICRRLIEDRDGQIEVEKSDLGGAKFIIRLPSSPSLTRHTEPHIGM